MFFLTTFSFLRFLSKTNQENFSLLFLASFVDFFSAATGLDERLSQVVVEMLVKLAVPDEVSVPVRIIAQKPRQEH